MALPPPETGLVIRYSYLWHDEKRRGQEEGSKDRPCAIVLATQKQGADAPTVVVAAVTHTPPHKDTPAIEIPAKVGKHLGLDDDRSWIITGEVNVFTWPGPDMRALPPSFTKIPKQTPEANASPVSGFGWFQAGGSPENRSMGLKTRP